MIEQKSYNFKILFDKIEEAENDNEYYEAIDSMLLQEVGDEIKKLEEYLNLLKEPQYQTYTRS